MHKINSFPSFSKAFPNKQIHFNKGSSLTKYKAAKYVQAQAGQETPYDVKNSIEVKIVSNGSLRDDSTVLEVLYKADRMGAVVCIILEEREVDAYIMELCNKVKLKLEEQLTNACETVTEIIKSSSVVRSDFSYYMHGEEEEEL